MKDNKKRRINKDIAFKIVMALLSQRHSSVVL